jgi:hypothetical protein
MFVYAKLVLANLLALPTRREVMDAIQQETFPRGLKEAYVTRHWLFSKTVGLRATDYDVLKRLTSF